MEVALDWKRAFGVAPGITSSLSEFDAALLTGHTPASFGQSMQGVTAVRKGVDFCRGGIRYQVKGNRPSGKRGSTVTKVGKAKNYEWDRLIWVRYDPQYVVQEAWEWLVNKYRCEFDAHSRLSPSDMRRGRQLA